MTQCTPETFSMLNWSLALIMGNIPPRDPDEERTKTIEVSARTSAVRAAGLVRADAWVWSR